MSEHPHLRRNSIAMLALRAADSVITIVPTVFVWFSVRSRWPELLGTPADVLIVVIGSFAVLGWLAVWWTTRFEVSREGVVLEKGVAVRRATAVSWDDVASVQVSRSAGARMLGCARVVIGIGAESKAGLVIEAVRQHEAAEMAAHFDAARSGATDPGACPGAAGTCAPEYGEAQVPASARLIYRIRPWEYLMLSVTYGQFVLVIPFVFGLVENVNAFLPSDWTPSALPMWTESVGITVLVAFLVAVPVAVVFGILVAWSRYRSFEVRSHRGVLSTSGGLVSAESRQVSESRVAGIKIQQNPLMRAMGYGRLRVISRQSGDRIGANVVFPAVRSSRLRDGIAEHFPAYAAGFRGRSRVIPVVRWLLLGLDAVVLGVVGVMVSGMPFARSVALFVLTCVALLVLTNYFWTAVAVDADSGTINVTRGFIWVTTYVVPYLSVHLFDSYELRMPKVSLKATRLAIYDTRAVQLWLPGADSLIVERLFEVGSGTFAAKGGTV